MKESQLWKSQEFVTGIGHGLSLSGRSGSGDSVDLPIRSSQ